jgi:hypothetical protein
MIFIARQTPDTSSYEEMRYDFLRRAKKGPEMSPSRKPRMVKKLKR